MLPYHHHIPRNLFFLGPFSSNRLIVEPKDYPRRLTLIVRILHVLVNLFVSLQMLFFIFIRIAFLIDFFHGLQTSAKFLCSKPTLGVCSLSPIFIILLCLKGDIFW